MVFKKAVADDDFDSPQKRNVREPEMCVDYLSYKFDEMDLAASWRVMTKQKKQVVDGIRLENASWRTWAKQRNNLKTISPQTLNWLKDSDVTWLYGPLHTVIRTEEDPFLKPRIATAEDTLGLMMTSKGTANTTKKAPLKSALKKVTTTDLLKRSATELSVDNNSNKKEKQHRKISISEANNELRAVSPAVLATHRQPKLRFNQQVEQCVALFADEREHGDILEEQETSDSETEPAFPKSMSNSKNTSEKNETDTPYFNRTAAVKSIKIIEPAKLKRSQSDADTDDVSSISSASTASSGFHCSAVSATTGDQDVYSSSDENKDGDYDEDEEDYYSSSFYNRSAYHHQTVETTSATSSLSSSPITTTSRRPSYGNRSSSVPIVQSYKEKTNAAEPALVTMHQNATDIHKDNGQKSSMLNNIATWAASYLWPGESAPKLPPPPKPSVSTTAIPIKTASSHSSISFSL
ncbi:hypothetical protein K501DRAFT_251621 [Backusella circina FSU 941]|nr:hypothetical protein K501DRAFT_251621 [Backusella circina FSU 941]